MIINYNRDNISLTTNLVEEVDYENQEDEHEPRKLPIRIKIDESIIQIDLSIENDPDSDEPFYDFSSVFVELRNHTISVSFYNDIGSDAEIIELHEFK